MQDLIFYYSDGTDSGPVSPELAEERGLYDCRHHTIGEDGPHCVDDRGLLPKNHAIGPNAQLGANQPAATTASLLDPTTPVGGTINPWMVAAVAVVVGVVVVSLQLRTKPAPSIPTPNEQPPTI
jgi:hypothetical protein